MSREGRRRLRVQPALLALASQSEKQVTTCLETMYLLLLCAPCKAFPHGP